MAQDLLDDDDEAAEDDVVIDGPGDVFAFVEVGRSFPDHVTKVRPPQQENRFSCG